jgi:hypothetical protein
MFGILLRLFVVGMLFLVGLGALALLGHGDKWYVALGAAVAVYLAGAFAIKRLFFRLLTSPFKAKGSVLADAQLEIHAMKPAPVLVLVAAGSAEDDAPEDDPSRRPGWRYFSVEATVTPSAQPTAPFQHWAPGELQIVPFDAKTEPDEDASRADEIATIDNLEVLNEDGFTADEGLSYAGSQRLRFLMGVDPSVTVAKIQYYFEGFGRIELPDSDD